MRSNMISKSETSALLDAVSSEWDIEVERAKNLKVYVLDGGAQMITGSGTRILKTGRGDYLPFLTETRTLEMFPQVTIDMGAVRFICKGANLMRPGIVALGEFARGGLVAIREESQGKYLAVGRAVVSSSEAAGMEKGEVVRNLHYISDAFWELGKAIRDDGP